MHMIGRDFAPAVLPVDAEGDQRDRAGMHHMNDAKTPFHAFASTSGGKARRKALQVFEYRPEQRSASAASRRSVERQSKEPCQPLFFLL
jgi:hypothetical protein